MDIYTLAKEFGLPLAILLIGIYVTYKHFSGEIDKKDAIIADKDKLIQANNEKYVQLLRDAISAETELISFVNTMKKDQ